MNRIADDARSWAELDRLLDTALSLPPAERLAWLDTLPPEHAALEPRLRSLLMRSAQIETSDFLGALPRISVSDKESAALKPPTGSAGDTIGPYRLIRELGSGGMGAVWLAERTDGILNRPVALKLPHLSLRHASLAERMAREREILATLAHPHIARLYDAGVSAHGQPYLALEYVEGVAVDEYCAQHGLGLRERLHLFLQIAGAVAYAHGKLVVHRDLKPANVLVTSAGDVRLLDFGVAKLLEDGRTHETVLTQFAGPAFTPDYASPEQIRGEPLGTASDIYSLGVMLFRLVTSERPYRLDRESRGALEEAVLNAEPARPSAVVARARRREVRGDLDTIILKCLKKDPDERYATVNALAEDLERYLSKRPVLAQDDSQWYRLRKFVARNRLAVAAATSVLLAIVVGSGVAIWQARVAQAEQRTAVEVKEFIATIFRDANPLAEQGKVVTAIELLTSARARVDQLDPSRPEIRLELLNLIGESLMGIGDAAAAEIAGKQALDESLRRFGAEHPQSVAARLLMIDVYRFSGRTPDMARELAILQPIVVRHAKERPLDLVRTLTDSAHLAVDEGRHDDSVAAATEALQVSIARLGEQHPATAGAATILAEASMIRADGRMIDPGERAKMLQTADRSLDLVRRAYPGQPRHAKVLDMRVVHARALARSGDLHGGIAELQQVLDDQGVAFGASSMAVAYTAGSLASFQRKVGDLEGALANHKRALDLLAKNVQVDSYTYAVNVLERGVTRLAARRIDEALADFSQARTTLGPLIGPLHIGTLIAQFNRAIAEAYLGRFQEAERDLSPLVEHGSEIKGLMFAYHAQGIVQRLRGDYGAAARSQQQALENMPGGPSSLGDELRILSELAKAQVELREFDQALQSLSRAQAVSTELKFATSPVTIDLLVTRGRAALSLGKPLEAIGPLETADQFWTEFDADGRSAGEAVYWLARCHEVMGDRYRARAAFSRAARILAASPLPADALLVQAARRRTG